MLITFCWAVVIATGLPAIGQAQTLLEEAQKEIQKQWMLADITIEGQSFKQMIETAPSEEEKKRMKQVLTTSLLHFKDDGTYVYKMMGVQEIFRWSLKLEGETLLLITENNEDKENPLKQVIHKINSQELVLQELGSEGENRMLLVPKQ
ncbi:MAG TPA: hypothetical protein DCM08_05990 [Microscillaceae bacterium]|nr:hypothetical protein [Microscillaceae bacterium]